MNAAAPALLDTVEALRAMLLAKRAQDAAEADRLRQINKELQSHRFGRGAETLPIDQLELGLEDAPGRAKPLRRLMGRRPIPRPSRGRTKTGQLRAYARDDRPWNRPEPPGVAYVYGP